MSLDNCTTCGARTKLNESSCEYCGVSLENNQHLSPENFINAISKSIKKSVDDASKNKNFIERYSYNPASAMMVEMDALRQLPIPTDAERLSAFFMYCHGNIQSRNAYVSTVDLPGAWRSKAKASYDLLRFKYLNNLQMQAYLDDFKPLYSSEAHLSYESKKNNEIAKSNANNLLMTLILASLLAIIFIALSMSGAFVRPN